jgi:hypothetical protein
MPIQCDNRPTVLNPNFDSYSGAFPGFIILNTKRLSGLSTVVKLYSYFQGCGYQSVGPNVSEADCFAIRRGVGWGWLNARGWNKSVISSHRSAPGLTPQGGNIRLARLVASKCGFALLTRSTISRLEFVDEVLP